MNLNEECLLQFLKNDRPAISPQTNPIEQNALSTDMKRILRHNGFVSFPLAILIRRPESER